MENTPAPATADIFTLPEFPEVELQGGNLLHPDGHRVAAILKQHTEHTANADGLKIMCKWLHKLGYSPIEITTHMARFAWMALRSPTPNDRTVFRPADAAAKKMVRGFVDRSMTSESRLFGEEHIAQFMEETRRGAKSALYSNHTSELDPVFLQIHMQRLQERTTNPRTAAAAQDLDRGLMAVMGHKVLIDRFRRVFSGVLPAICTVSAKYRTKLREEDKHLVQTYTDNGARMMNHLMQSPDHTVMAFPQGGMTRGNRIAFQGIMGPTSNGVTILPIFIQPPFGFLRPDLREKMCDEPSKVDIFCGEPFTPHTRSTEALVLRFREKLQAVGVDTATYEWGYMKRKRTDEGIAEEFVEI